MNEKGHVKKITNRINYWTVLYLRKKKKAIVAKKIAPHNKVILMVDVELVNNNFLESR